MMVARAPLLAVLLVLAGAATAAGQEEESFPHERHARLFPLCTGCHAGIVSGNPDRVYPGETACTNCHDGAELPRVAAPAPSRPPGNLVFSHPEHAEAVQGEEQAPPGCATCHRQEGAEDDMSVQPATAERCLECHAHQAPSHLAEGRDCAACHSPLARLPELPVSTIAGFPRPPGHDTEGFLSSHDPGADVTSCATCHARESCTRCHLNASQLPAVVALETDDRVARLVADRPPAYPTPGSHRGQTWRWSHGEEAGDGAATCANCHARPSCLSCHRAGTLGAVDALPERPSDDPRGARVAAGLVHPPGYALHHAAPAATGDGCRSCHQEDFCASCHQAAVRPGFHEAGYVELHGADAYGAGGDCVSCHSTETFCRACHAQLGMADGDRLGTTFHNARPFWLLGHGIAARQGLEGCVSCHTQSDCAACHSSFLGWGVNPHGPGWNGAALQEANPLACTPCHLGGAPR